MERNKEDDCFLTELFALCVHIAASLKSDIIQRVCYESSDKWHIQVSSFPKLCALTVICLYPYSSIHPHVFICLYLSTVYLLYINET